MKSRIRRSGKWNLDKQGYSFNLPDMLRTLVTIDIKPWNQIANSALQQSDFEDGRLRQVIGDLSDAKFFSAFSDTMSQCDFLFVDGPKDLVFEPAFLRHLSTIKLPPNALVVFDDIRLWNMLKIWHDLQEPKLDLTSFGHFTGTGIVDWNGRSALAV